MLHSRLLRDDPQLQACAAHDAAHLTPGSGGAGVGRLQLALLALGAPAVSLAEMRARRYGPSTAAAVLAYKQRRGIINRSYQQQADNIAGRMTLAQIDAELCALDRSRPATRWQADPLIDSGPAFALRSAMVNALARPDGGANGAARWAIGAGPGNLAGNIAGNAAGPDTGPATDLADTLLQTSAPAAHRVLRTLGAVRRGTRQSVYAEPGLLRDHLCRTATQAPVMGKRFDEPPVSSCWGRVRRADKRDEPMATQDPIRTAWCGIFATWLWWLAGQDVIWIDGVGPGHAASRRRLRTSTLIPMLAPGDIIVEGFGHIHHMLVLSIAADRSSAEIIEGNAGNAPAHQTTVKRRVLKLPKDGSRHWFYSVDTLRNPASNHGYNIPEAIAPGKAPARGA